MDPTPFLFSRGQFQECSRRHMDSNQRGQEWSASLGQEALNWALKDRKELFPRTEGFLGCGVFSAETGGHYIQRPLAAAQAKND